MRRQFLPPLLFYLRELLDVLAFHRVAHAASLHREVHDLREIFQSHRCRERTIIEARVALLCRSARELHRAHRRHDFLLEDRLADLAVLAHVEFVAEILFHKIHVPVDGLYPRLAPLLALYPTRVGAQVHEFSERIILEIFFRFFGELPHMLRYLPLLLADLGALGAVENIGLCGSDVIGEDELALDFVLAPLDGRQEILVGLGNAHHFARHLVRDDHGLVAGAFIGRLH